MSQYQKITRMPIGLGGLPLDDAEDVCILWNRAVSNGGSPTDWVRNNTLACNAHAANPGGTSLAEAGWVETNHSLSEARLTEKGAGEIKKWLDEN